MGACGSKLQHERFKSIKKHFNPTKKELFTAKQPLTSDTEIISNSNDYSECIQLENKPLINLRFNRTLFCEDITYEYIMHYNYNNTNNENKTIPQWTLRLTVENLTKFYVEILEKYCSNTNTIPNQFGKVMDPKIFTSLLENIIHQPSLLTDKNLFFSENTANFLNIPIEIRPIIQYNPDMFIHNLDDNTFKYFDIICANNDKFKYLSHNINAYSNAYQDWEITCYSYWIRSKVTSLDFLLNIISDNIFYVVMSDLSYNISKTLNNIGFDDNCAWIITDYLPKYLSFPTAQIIYKYDANSCANGSFLLETNGSKLVETHNINMNELYNMCETLRMQHISHQVTDIMDHLSLENINSNETLFEESILDMKPIKMDEINEDKFVKDNDTFVYLQDENYNKKKCEIQCNNYDLSPSYSIDTVVDVQIRETFPNAIFNSKFMKSVDK